jgi:hypothetical protein
MAINERLIDTAVSGCSAEPTKEGLILHLDASDVDSYDGDGDEWVDIKDHEYTPTTNVSEHFNTVIYDGQNTDLSVTGVGFTPDLVWIKCRDVTTNHHLSDSVRGGTYTIFPNLTNIESSSPSIETIDTDGFTVFGNRSSTNRANQEYVAWCFKAGGAAVLNEEGDIDSQVSANNDLGFSIVSWSGDGSDMDIGHGLDAVPEMIIRKNLISSVDWMVDTSAIDGSWDYLKLNTTASKTNHTFVQPPTSTIFNTMGANYNSSSMIAYCFASKRGVSKVGSYTGTGAAGNKVYTGFEPAFIMLKNTNDSAAVWIMVDNKRDPNNPVKKKLAANSNVAENDSTTIGSDTQNQIEFNRDGFTLLEANNYVNTNKNGDNFIYYAVAKNTNETSLMPSKDDFTTGSVETTDLELDLDANDYSGSGDWLDGTSNSNDGTITGATYVNDGVSDYFEFGSGKHVTTTYDLPTSGGVSIELWFNANSGTTSYLAGNNNSSSSIRNAIAIGAWTGGFAPESNESIVFYQYNGSSANSDYLHFGIKEGHEKYQDGKWHHLVVIDTGSSHKMYVDSEEKTIAYADSGADATSRINWSNFCLGKANWTSSGYMNGKVGQCRIYETALTPAQIQSNYEATRIYNTPELELHLDAASFDGSTNTPSTWTDSSSNSNNGTITGGATFDAELGNWLNFDGSNDYVQLPLNLHNTAFSLEFWAKDTLNSSDGYIIANSSGSTQAGWLITRSPNNNYNFRINNGSTNHVLLSSGAVDSTVWHHVAVTWDNTTNANGAKMYINGSLSNQGTSTSTTSFSFTNSYARLMAGPSGVYHSDGLIGQVRMYDAVLTQAQIRQNYNFTKPNYPNGYDGDLISAPTWNSGGYFDFDGSQGVNLPAGIFPVNPIITTSTWVKGASFSNSGAPDIIYQSAAEGSFTTLFTDSNYLKVYVRDSTPTTYTPINYSLSNFNTSSWYHLLVTYEGLGGSIKLYVNGSNVASGTLPTTTITYTTGNSIASQTGINYLGWIGSISKFKLYHKVLTQAEITALHSEGR